MRNSTERPALRNRTVTNRTVTMTLTLPELYLLNDALITETDHVYDDGELRDVLYADLCDLQLRVHAGIAEILAHA